MSCSAQPPVCHQDPEDLEGWAEVKPEDRQDVLRMIKELEEKKNSSPEKKAKKETPKKATTPKKAATPSKKAASNEASPKAKKAKKEDSTEKSPSPLPATTTRPKVNPDHRDNNFREFRRLCAAIAEVPGYLEKSATVSRYLTKGSGKQVFEGDLHLWVRLLLPGVVKRVYNMQGKQIVKVFSKILGTDEEEMVEDLSEGQLLQSLFNHIHTR